MSRNIPVARTWRVTAHWPDRREWLEVRAPTKHLAWLEVVFEHTSFWVRNIPADRITVGHVRHPRAIDEHEPRRTVWYQDLKR